MSGNVVHSFSHGSELTSGPHADRQRRGTALIWAVLVMLMIIGFVGLTIDTGLGYLVGHQLQDAADASSMAAAQKLGEELEVIQEAARTIGAENYASAETVLLKMNPGNTPDGDIVVGIYDRQEHIFIPSLKNPNAVKVVARRAEGSLGGSLPLIFGPIFGVNTIDLERTAIAMIGGGTGAGLIALHETDDWTFRLSGTITLDITTPDGEGAVQINSDSSRALKIDGGPTLIASDINVYASSVSDPPDFDGDVNTSQPRVPDPLAELTPPADRTLSPTASDSAITGGEHNLEPGYYPDGIAMTGGTVNLAPGIYVLDGEGLKVTGGDLSGDGVMLYIIDDIPGQPTSQITLTGNGIIDLTPAPLDSGLYGGILLWQDADNTNTATVVGTDNFTGFEGTVYIPSAQLDVAGTSDNFGFNQLIVDKIWVHGSGTMTINYDGRFPAPGTAVFLVE